MSQSSPVSESSPSGSSAPVPQVPGDDAAIVARSRSVIDSEIDGLEAIKRQIDGNFSQAVAFIENCQGRVIVTGMGKSGIIGKKIAATLSSTGTPALFLHPAEGSHGDLGVMTRQDVVLAISNSGETPEILAVLPLVKRFGLPLISMTGKPESTLGLEGDCVLNIAVPQEACPLGLAPTTSTTATAAMGDALAVVLLERRGFSEEDFAIFHPAGSLGKRLLLRVRDVMHSGALLPLIAQDLPFMEALVAMSEKKMGMAIVVDTQGQMLGILTDGDVRRALTRFSDPREIPLKDVMTLSPKRIDSDELAVTALRLMEEFQITVLVICEDGNRPVGALHLHDLLKAGLA